MKSRNEFNPCEAIFTALVYLSDWNDWQEVEVRQKFHTYGEAEEWGLELVEKYHEAENKCLRIYDL